MWAFGALVTDLSKTFDCLHNGLLIAKLDVYGFDKKSAKLIEQYLSNRKQMVKVRMHKVHGNKFFIEFQRGQSLVCLFSISFCVTYLFS